MPTKYKTLNSIQLIKKKGIEQAIKSIFPVKFVSNHVSKQNSGISIILKKNQLKMSLNFLSQISLQVQPSQLYLGIRIKISQPISGKDNCYHFCCTIVTIIAAL
jgi:hypothetical protein